MPFGTESIGVPTYGEGGLVAVTDRPQLIVEVAFLPPTQTPTEADWIDFSTLARGSITITRGRERAFDDFTPGTFSGSLESTDRRFDPLNDESPYVGRLLPNRWIRVSARYGYALYRRFTGFVEVWDQQYESRDYATVKITATDALGRLAAQDVVQPFLIIGRGRIGRARIAGPGSVIAERTGERVERVLTNIGITNYDVDRGYSTLPAGQGEGNVLEYLQKVAKTEDARFFASVENVLTFRSRYAAVVGHPEMVTSQGSFGALGVADHFVADVNIAPHISQLYNHVVINLEGGGQVEVEDADSISGPNGFDRRTYTRSVLLTDAVAGKRIARHILTRHKAPIPRLSKLVIEPDGDPNDLYPAVLARELGDRITVVGTPQGVGTPINQQAHIEGITETIRIEDTGPSWETEWSLAAADLTNYLVIGQGRIGIDRIAA